VDFIDSVSGYDTFLSLCIGTFKIDIYNLAAFFTEEMVIVIYIKITPVL